MSKNNTSFDSSNQPKDRKPRGKSERTKILDAMKREGQTEDGFYDLLITRAFDPKDSFTFKELLIRISPIPKSVSPMVEFEFNEKANPHIQATQVLAAISLGKIPSDIGQIFISSISSMLKIQELTDFEERLKAIEDASKQD